MAGDDESYKREEDHKWRERVDERLAALTSGETVQDDRLDDHESDLAIIREMLEGSPKDKNDNGFKGDIHDLSVGLREIRAVMMPDHLGQGGVIARLRTLEKNAGLEEKSVEFRWKTLIAILGWISAATVAAIYNGDRIVSAFRHFRRPPTPQSVHGKRRGRVRESPAPEEEGEPWR